MINSNNHMTQKMLTTSLLIIFNLIVLNVSAQYTFDWARSTGGVEGDAAQCIAIDTSGNIYTAGLFRDTADFDPGPGVFNLISNGGGDIFVQKYDASGNFIWARGIGGADNDIAYSIAIDAGGDVHVIGYFESTVDFDPGPGIVNLSAGSTYDAFILKLNTAGNFEWVAQLAGNINLNGYGIAVDTSSNVYSTGSFYQTVDFDPGVGVMNLTSNGSRDIYIQKLDASGNLVWAKNIGGSSGEGGGDIKLDASGNIYSSGTFSGVVDFDTGPGTTLLTSNGGPDLFVQKLDASGNLLWAKSTGGPEQEIMNDMAVDPAGNVVITGDFRSTADFDPGVGVLNSTSIGGRDIFIQKLNSSGDLIWANQFGSTDNDSGYSITTDAASNTIISGFFNGTIDFDNGPGVTNLTEGWLGSGDIFIAKYDPVGELIWAESFGSNGYEIGKGLALDKDENLLVTGSFDWTVDFDYGLGVTNLISNGGQDLFIQKLNPCIPSASTDTHIVCDSLIWIDGITYTTSNTLATWRYYNVAGCDSIVTLDLTVNYSSAETDVQTSCDSYLWINGSTYYTSNNTSTWTLTNAAGCDSLVTLDLTIINSTTETDVQTTCDSYTWMDGITYTSSNNTATWTLTNAVGCDSIITLDLTVNYSNTGTDVQTACNSFDWIDGNTYTASNNTASWLLTNAAGCDSIVTLDLAINYPNTETDVQTVCDSLIWIDGITYTSSNNSAAWTLTNAVGCDSVVTLDLTIIDSSTGTDIQTACDTYFWIDGNTYTASNNTATWTLTNAVGCDSVVTLNLTVNYSTAGTNVLTACDSIIWIDGNTYTSSNNSATWTLTNATGCDSIVSLDLTINSNSITDVQTACDSFNWIDGNTYTSSNNIATWTLTNAAGCDSVITLDLTINPMPDANVNQLGALLTATQVGANYQWLDCDDNYSIIGGETNQTYTPLAVIGNYSIEIDLNGCVDTSACYLVDYTGLSDLYKGNLSLSPNPADDKIAILGLNEVSGLQGIEVISSSGKLEFKVDGHTSQLNVSELVSGLYFVRVIHERGIETLRFIKK